MVRVDKTSAAPSLARFARHGMIRSMLIAYGTGAFVYFFPRPHPTEDGDLGLSPATSVLQMLLIGLAVQLLAFAIRKIVTRYERAHGLEGALSPLAMLIFELVADGVTVFLFALATFRGIASFGSDL